MAQRKLTDAERERLRHSTKNAADVLLDDLGHIRRIIISEQPNPGDLRRLSALMRRILIDGDLIRIAAPRIGRLNICAPNHNELYIANDKSPFALIAADTFSTQGLTCSRLCFGNSELLQRSTFDPSGEMVGLPVSSFNKQRVLCFRGQWITRANLIEYVANVGHGVHSGIPRKGVELLIQKVRNAITLETGTGPDGKPCPVISVKADVLVLKEPPIEFRAGCIDLALLYIISTARFLVDSPDVIALERFILDEI